MNRSGTNWTVWLTLALVLLALPAIATAGETDTSKSKEAQEAKSPENESNVSPLIRASRRARGEKQDSEAKVYGNDDLDEMFGPSESTPPEAQDADSTEPTEAARPAEGEAQPDALEQMFASEARKKERATEIAGAEQRVTDAKQAIVDLEKRLLAVKNPLLARPSAPEEGAEEWKAGDGQSRLQQTELQIAAAREALAEAERELSELKRGS
jgi:hypothetical protein